MPIFLMAAGGSTVEAGGLFAQVGTVSGGEKLPTLAERSERGTVRHRIGDRRSHPRFEILGAFAGSLQIWHRLEVRNLSPGGASVEWVDRYPPDVGLWGRATFRGSHGVRAQVRHITVVSENDGRRYLVGLEFPEGFAGMDDLLVGQPLLEDVAVRSGGDRRRHRRVRCPDGAEIEFPVWATAELSDVSMSGAMLTSKTPLGPGAKVRFRTRFGEGHFDAEVDVRWSMSRPGPKAEHNVGVSFVSMDEESRQNLGLFLVTGRN
jgi:hypothetical protein